MKTYLVLVSSVIGFCFAQSVQSADIAVPSLGSIVQRAETIVAGQFSLGDSNVWFLVERSLKGDVGPGQNCNVICDDITISAFDLRRYVAGLNLHGSYLLLGQVRDGSIFLTWLYSSIWPSGISQYWSPLKDVSACEGFAERILEYDRLLQGDMDNFVAQILSDLSQADRRAALLAYLDSDTSELLGNRDLRSDILNIVAARLSAAKSFDAWSINCMTSLAPSLPPSISIPYRFNCCVHNHTESESSSS